MELPIFMEEELLDGGLEDGRILVKSELPSFFVAFP